MTKANKATAPAVDSEVVTTITYVAQRKFVLGNKLIPKDGEVVLNSRQAEFLLKDGAIVSKDSIKASVKESAKSVEVAK